MSSNWLGQDWPQVFPIDPKSSRFPNLTKHWGEEINRKASGAYILAALKLDGKSDERRVISRLFAEDSTGTLYIGKADRNLDDTKGGLAGRLGNLGNAIRPDRSGKNHKLHVIRDYYQEQLPADSLVIYWFELDKDWFGLSFENASQLEAVLIDKYISCFGEAPPFNSQGGILPENLKPSPAPI